MKQSTFAVGLSLVLLAAPKAFAGDPAPDPQQLAWNPARPYRLEKLDSLRRFYHDDQVFDAFVRGGMAGIGFDFADHTRLLAYLNQAEILLHASFYRPDDGSALLYEAMGDHMLSLLADTLQKGLANGALDADADPYRTCCSDWPRTKNWSACARVTSPRSLTMLVKATMATSGTS